MTFKDLTKLKSRDELGAFLNQHNLIGEGVEVGVLNGVSARGIISQWEGQRLYLCDCWGQHDSRIYREPGDHGPDFAACLKEVRVLAQEYAPRVMIMQKPSLDAVGEFDDGSLSFVAIDANHEFCAVIADAMAWYPKVVSGGILTFHDATYNEPPFKEVKRALEEWVKLVGLKQHLTPDCGSAWFIKP